MQSHLELFESHDVSTHGAFNTYYQALVAVNHTLCDDVPPSQEQATSFKHAMLVLVRELASFDAAMPRMVGEDAGWEVGLEVATKM